MGADNSEIGHAHIFVMSFLDQAHSLHFPHIVWIFGAYGVEEIAIYLVNNFKVAGEESLKEKYRPLLKSLRHERVIGIGKRTPRQVPGNIPG